MDGSVGLISASLGPPEKGFVRTRFGSGLISLLLVSLVTCIPFKRLRYLAKTGSYFRDIEQEMEYYLSQNEHPNSNGKRYKLVNKTTGVSDLNNPSSPDIQVVFSIEGSNVFDKGLNNKWNTSLRETALGNIDRIKNWEYPPLWVSLGHHFFNELCGHPKSLPGIVGLLINQKRELGTGITPFGMEVIRKLLDPAGKKILIDVKHMSWLSRKSFYAFCQDYYGTNTWDPIVVSHGACNGFDQVGSEVNSSMLKDIQGEFFHDHMYPGPINLYDEDILKVAYTNGIIGIMLDERRLADKNTLKKNKKCIRRKELLYSGDNQSKEAKVWWTKTVWDNLYYIAYLLNMNGFSDCWDIQCIGTDFDGMINPMDVILTAAEMNDLRDGLLIHAQNYQNHPEGLFGLTPGQVVNRIMHENAFKFIQQHL
jgi:microsomal dipeptidase-like Zn-dependent dipeptidase